MEPMKPALLAFVFAAGLSAQQVQVTSPNVLANISVDRPFAGGIGRYQQWYSAGSLAGGFPEPVRINRMEFFAGLAPTSQAVQIDCEVWLGHGKLPGVTGAFDNNWDAPPTLVKPRAFVQLSAGTLGQVVLTLPLTTEFTWDGARPLLLEVRIHGNTNNNQPFVYNFRGSATSIGVTSRVYAAGSVGAPNGAVLAGVGMVTRFTARRGAMVPYGAGCPGEGGHVPVGTAAPLPWPGITWTHTLANASSQRLAILAIGDSRDSPFPVDLAPLFGLPPSNCLLRNNAVFTPTAFTVGGGAGAGVASLPIPLPATTGYVGASLFSQWVVFDPLAPTGFFAVSGGLWSIVAPVGG